jgi:hypothetical protein
MPDVSKRTSVREKGNAFFQIESDALGIKPYLLGKPLPGSATAGQGRKPRSGGVARNSRSRHFDLVGRGDDPWSVDLVVEAASFILLGGFVWALVAVCIH